MNENFKEALNSMTIAKNMLVRSAVALEKNDNSCFESTIKEIKQTIGDLCCSIKVIEDEITIIEEAIKI